MDFNVQASVQDLVRTMKHADRYRQPGRRRRDRQTDRQRLREGGDRHRKREFEFELKNMTRIVV